MKKVLIVDDSADDLNMLAYFLSRKGYRVSRARDGREGVTMALEILPHLILMDLGLPILNGWDAIEMLKKDQRTKHIPVLVVTGYASNPLPECEGWLPKPCDLEKLDLEVARILEARGTC